MDLNKSKVCEAKVSKGFGAPGKLSGGQFSAENGRQPRTDVKSQFAIVANQAESLLCSFAHWASACLYPPLAAAGSAPLVRPQAQTLPEMISFKADSFA